jgi:hypothetical protein
MDATALIAKGAFPEPLSTGEAVIGVGLVLAGVFLAVVIAAVRAQGRR